MENNLQALVLDETDNVATLLSDGLAGDIVTLKGRPGNITLTADIAYGHKVALVPIDFGMEIIKYGHRIGVASSPITSGAWIHLHNMVSAVDATFKKRIDSCSTNR